MNEVMNLNPHSNLSWEHTTSIWVQNPASQFVDKKGPLEVTNFRLFLKINKLLIPFSAGSNYFNSKALQEQRNELR